MKNQKVADYYDKLYSDDEKAFGGEPLPLVKILTEHLVMGKILEIGAGAGRNALFLASKGFHVRAIDIFHWLLRDWQKRLKEGVLIWKLRYRILQKKIWLKITMPLSALSLSTI